MDFSKGIYISGPYSATTEEQKYANVEMAKRWAQHWMHEKQWAVFCPHTMTVDWEIETDLSWDEFLENDLFWVKFCDAICMLPGWRDSRGAKMELAKARELGLRVFDAEVEEWIE